MNTADINAVQEKKMETFLNSLGVLEEVKEGKARCKFCKKTIEINKIYGVFPESGSVKIVCNKPDCILQAMEFIRKNNIG